MRTDVATVAGELPTRLRVSGGVGELGSRRRDEPIPEFLELAPIQRWMAIVRTTPTSGTNEAVEVAADEDEAALRAEFGLSAARRIDTIEEALGLLLTGCLDADRRQRAAGEAHRLAGSLGTFGAPDGSTAARLLEDALTGTDPIPSENVPRLVEAGLALRPALARATEAALTEAPPEPASTPRNGTTRVGSAGTRRGRRRRTASLAETDPLTGLASRRAAVRQLEYVLARADERGDSLALAILDVDGMTDTNRRLGYDAGDAVLRELAERLRAGLPRDAVVGRWVSDSFIVGFPGSSAEEAERRLLDLAESPSAPFSAGVAAWPSHGRDITSLARAAEEACAGATTESGRSRVLCAAVAEPVRPDVVLVDDDEALGGLLLHALAARGYTTRLIADGRQAAEALLGPNRSVSPRLVLLDVNLPGLNGLALLRLLVDGGVTARTRVVMLTGRTAEVEVVESFHLGAVDHVTKPFSVPVLLERVRRALES